MEKIRRFDQGESAIKYDIEIRGGVCLGVSMHWLNLCALNSPQGTPKRYYEGLENEGLLSECNLIEEGYGVHNSLGLGSDPSYNVDSAISWLKKKGLNHQSQNDIGLDYKKQFKVAGSDFITERNIGNISETVLRSSNRYFILLCAGSMFGTTAGHAMAFMRHHSLIGKSSVSEFVEPNNGIYKFSNLSDLKSKLHILLNDYKDTNYSLLAFS